MNFNDISGEAVGGLTATIVGLAFLFRKLQSLWIREGEAQTVSSAGTSIITTLRDEVNRLSSANTALNRTVLDLSTENIKLKQEISELRTELRDLHRSIEMFTEVAKFCKDCKYGNDRLDISEHLLKSELDFTHSKGV